MYHTLFRLQKRCCFAAFASLLIPVAAVAQSSSPAPDYHPTVGIQQEDLAVARSHFETKIQRRGPPPAEWDDMITPAAPLGGTLSGRVTNATSGAGVARAIVDLYESNTFVDSATADSQCPH